MGKRTIRQKEVSQIPFLVGCWVTQQSILGKAVLVPNMCQHNDCLCLLPRISFYGEGALQSSWRLLEEPVSEVQLAESLHLRLGARPGISASFLKNAKAPMWSCAACATPPVICRMLFWFVSTIAITMITIVVIKSPTKTHDPSIFPENYTIGPICITQLIPREFSAVAEVKLISPINSLGIFWCNLLWATS